MTGSRGQVFYAPEFVTNRHKGDQRSRGKPMLLPIVTTSQLRIDGFAAHQKEEV